MKTLSAAVAGWGYERYISTWEDVALAGAAAAHASDASAHGWRYLALDALLLTVAEVAMLRRLTVEFGRLLDLATVRVLDDPDWWPTLAWPWPAVELARLEPAHPHGRATLYGRFDWLMDERGRWQLAEYNADTPSGGRERQGWEPSIFRLQGGQAAGLRRISPGAGTLLTRTLERRLTRFEAENGRPVHTVGVVSSHGWVEDMAQTRWVADLLDRAGRRTLVGDVRDLSSVGGTVLLRGVPVQALYRFYPVEQLYRLGMFAPVIEAAIDRRLLLLNGLRGFLAQSKAVLAWLWAYRGDPQLGPGAKALIQGHLPATEPIRSPPARRLLPRAVVKHVNGREGDSVVFGDALERSDWEARLREGGFVVQRRVKQMAVEAVELDELSETVCVVRPAYACVGTFCVDGRFGGCYSRLDGPITTARATFVSTFQEVCPDGRRP